MANLPLDAQPVLTLPTLDPEVKLLMDLRAILVGYNLTRDEAHRLATQMVALVKEGRPRIEYTDWSSMLLR